MIPSCTHRAFESLCFSDLLELVQSKLSSPLRLWLSAKYDAALCVHSHGIRRNAVHVIEP